MDAQSIGQHVEQALASRINLDVGTFAAQVAIVALFGPPACREALSNCEGCLLKEWNL